MGKKSGGVFVVDRRGCVENPSTVSPAHHQDEGNEQFRKLKKRLHWRWPNAILHAIVAPRT
jgi:hypothetical protein